MRLVVARRAEQRDRDLPRGDRGRSQRHATADRRGSPRAGRPDKELPQGNLAATALGERRGEASASAAGGFRGGRGRRTESREDDDQRHSRGRLSDKLWEPWRRMGEAYRREEDSGSAGTASKEGGAPASGVGKVLAKSYVEDRDFRDCGLRASIPEPGSGAAQHGGADLSEAESEGSPGEPVTWDCPDTGHPQEKGRGARTAGGPRSGSTGDGGDQ